MICCRVDFFNLVQHFTKIVILKFGSFNNNNYDRLKNEHEKKKILNIFNT